MKCPDCDQVFGLPTKTCPDCDVPLESNDGFGLCIGEILLHEEKGKEIAVSITTQGEIRVRSAAHTTYHSRWRSAIKQIKDTVSNLGIDAPPDMSTLERMATGEERFQKKAIKLGEQIEARQQELLDASGRPGAERLAARKSKVEV